MRGSGSGVADRSSLDVATVTHGFRSYTGEIAR